MPTVWLLVNGQFKPWCDAFVLDDGFQHLRIARDLDIVTIDATSPWGDGALLPHGRLREEMTAYPERIAL